MLREDLIVITQAINWLKVESVWLCTVLNTYGSSPRSPGSLLVAKGDGQFLGSLSGGCIEEDFLQRIQNGEYLEASHVVRYGQDGLATHVNLPCGGSLDVLIEYLPNNEISLNYLLEMQSALQGYSSILKELVLPQHAKVSRVAQSQYMTQVERHDNLIRLLIASPPKLVIAGLSNVGMYCANFALTLGFEVTICEHREDELVRFADQIDPQYEIIPLFPARYLEENSCSANTAIVSLTHDPRIDDLTLMEAVNTPAFYIGAMGSQRTSDKRRERLINTAEMSTDELNRIHAPIGIPIGSKTPPEIALAIMADIVANKNGKSTK